MGGGWKVHPGPGVNPERQQEWDVADSRPISYCALCGRHQPELLVPSHPSSIATHLLFPKTAEKLVSPPPLLRERSSLLLGNGLPTEA